MKPQILSKHALPFKTKNKQRRQHLHLKQKRARDSIKRDERFRRKKDEEKDPFLKEERLATNIPVTIDSKRTWDDYGSDEENLLGIAVDVARMKRRKVAEDDEQEQRQTAGELSEDSDKEMEDDDADSMLDSDSEFGSDEGRFNQQASMRREASPVPSSASARLDLTPDALAEKFPTLFKPAGVPKVLVTTSINSTLHEQAGLLTALFPNSVYIRRSAHRYGHKYSVREISKFASNRGYTAVIILNEDQKKPNGLDVVHLPSGPMFHFSISNWVDGKRLPGHGNATGHYPELILNNFKTPLGLLTAHLFRTLFPLKPELSGRQVVTLHNQRDYIFFRQHRYVFRDKRTTERSVTSADGKVVKGVEDIKAGLQELGPRFTLKLRRVDKGIQKTSGQEWKWKAGDEKVRTRFAL